MSDNQKDGGDIASGFGDPKVSGPVSDEKAEQMKQGNQDSSDGSGDADDADADTAGSDAQFLDPEADADKVNQLETNIQDPKRPSAGGGGGGGGW